MSNNYQVVYRGALVQGVDLATAKRNVASLFKSTEDKISPLFSGKSVIVKKDLDQTTAEKYKLAMQKAGAICQVEKMEEVPAQQPVQSAAKTSEVAISAVAVAENAQTRSVENAPPASDTAMASSLDSVTIDPPGTIIIEAEPVEPVNIDTSGMDMAEAGEIIMDPEPPVQPPVIDTSGLVIDEPGVVLVEAEDIPPVYIDTSGIDMAEAGEVIIEPEQIQPANIDISGIEMAEPGEIILEKEEEELPPLPNTDGLSLDS